MKIDIINGPNLNLLGRRGLRNNGNRGFESFLKEIEVRFPSVSFSYSQSNVEGEIVTMVQTAGMRSDGLIINPGGYTHTSVAIADAVAAVNIPVVEVHITNLLSREEFRHISLTGRYCRGTIMGFGLDSYRLAAEALMEILKKNKDHE